MILIHDTFISQVPNIKDTVIGCNQKMQSSLNSQSRRALTKDRKMSICLLQLSMQNVDLKILLKQSVCAKKTNDQPGGYMYQKKATGKGCLFLGGYFIHSKRSKLFEKVKQL